MGMRLLARLIDGVLVFIVVIIAITASGIHIFNTSSVNGTDSASFSLYGASYFKALLIGLVITGGYEVGMIATKGATLGKMACGVRVANIEDGRTPSFGQAVIRWIIPGVAGVIFGLLQLIVYLSPFFDSTHRNRGWYDYAAKTIAVRTR
ncbi:MAG TPA: RDD family protein [Mycobacteriales bacterium]|nr:RDD family protein [Mycobacteriales bacterium]